MLGEILGVSFLEGGSIVFHEVDFSPDLFGLVRLEAAEAEIGVEAASDALKEFLVGFPRGGEEKFFVTADAADEPVAGDQFAERAGIDVSAGNVFGTPNLTGNVAGFGCPLRSRHAGEFVVNEDEALGDVVFDVAFAEIGAVFGAGELAKSHARLCPVGFGAFRGRIVRGELKGHFVGSGSDGVIDNDAVDEGVTELHRFAVVAQGDGPAFVIDHSVFDPIGIGGVGAAVGLEVVDAELAVGEMFALDDEPMAIAPEGETGIFLGRILGEEKGNAKQGEEG